MQEITDEQIKEFFPFVQKIVNFNELAPLTPFTFYKDDKSFGIYQKIDSYMAVNLENGDLEDFYGKKVIVSYVETEYYG
ncbi:MAG: hypothetical protein BV456_04620 [Thermoplasmata archaeon M8B2D]|nr:MAG: hypothetical protein BV456_04620 [Thermoplasmata archaeon M8B2D]